MLYNPIFNGEIYLNLENLIFENQSENYEDYQIDLYHIHQRMLFDSFNEVLDTKRVYGLQGTTYPQKLLWRPKKTIKENDVEKILDQCKN